MAKNKDKGAPESSIGVLSPQYSPCVVLTSDVLPLCLVVPPLISFSSTVTALSVEEGRNPACAHITTSISSSSDVYYPGIYPLRPLLHSKTSNIIALIGDSLYVKGVNHRASSSIQLAKCVVESGTAADIGVIVGILFS